jgi:hypothetical protein
MRYHIDNEYAIHSTLGRINECSEGSHQEMLRYNLDNFSTACEIAKHLKLTHEQEVKAEFDLGWGK